jgi:hypothetical protein
LIPPETGAYELEKSKELFQREAESLYKINHPQVPQFRANFEQDGRLFLVQTMWRGKPIANCSMIAKLRLIFKVPIRAGEAQSLALASSQKPRFGSYYSS